MKTIAMNELKKKIKVLHTPKAAGKWEQCFKEIAEELIFNYAIKVNDEEYRLAEIEFYFWSQDHEDDFIHAINWNEKDRGWKLSHGYDKQMLFGHWYFHYSGIDITIGSKEVMVEKDSQPWEFEKYCFGGILIRSLRDQKDNYINGPLKCKNRLLNEIQSIDQKQLDFGLVRVKEEKVTIVARERFGLGKAKNQKKFRGSKYRFYIVNDKNKVAKKKT